MPPKKKSKEQTPLPIKEEGVIWVAQSGTIYKESEITLETMEQLAATNVYARSMFNRLKAMIFNDKPSIVVYGPDGEEDEDIANRLFDMMESKDVRLYEKMALGYFDVFFFGAAIFNPVWEYQGSEAVLISLRRLPAPSFRQAPYLPYVAHGLLRGVIYNEDTEELEYYQTAIGTKGAQVTTKIENVLHLKDPGSNSLVGDPIVYPAVPVLEMLKFAWVAQMQQVNRIGAPVIFIKVINPRPATPMTGGVSDIDWAKNILQNWGKDTAHTLRENMEVVNLNVTEGNIAERIIDQLTALLIDFISPARLISKEGTLIGGSTSGEQLLMESYIRGVHSWLEASFEGLLNQYLEYNGYENYQVELNIPLPSADRTKLKLEQAVAGHYMQVLDTNEKRVLLDHEPLDDEGMAKMEEEYARRQPKAPTMEGEIPEEQGGGGAGAGRLPPMRQGGGMPQSPLEKIGMLQVPKEPDPNAEKAGDSLAKAIDRLLDGLADEVISEVKKDLPVSKE